MHIHIRVHHGVLVWMYVGVVCGIIALVNILSRNLSESAVTWILALGVLFWLVGGILCYAWDTVRIEVPSREARKNEKANAARTGNLTQKEWHYASEFVLPGHRKSVFPRRY